MRDSKRAGRLPWWARQYRRTGSEESMPRRRPACGVRSVPATLPAQPSPLYQEVLAWVTARLQQRGYARPLCKRLALLGTGLIASKQATLSAVAETVHGLAITPAKEESIARRLGRILTDERLDPHQVLTDLFADLVPTLLAGVLAAHAANEPSGAAHHARFLPLTVVLDESTKEDEVHLLVAGLAYQGILLPLAVRVWEQGAPLAAGDYWLAVHGVCLAVQALLPPALRDHVLLLADRAYGIPRMLDLARALDWAWVLRVQGQTRVLRADGTVCPIRDLAPRPGTGWVSGFDPTAPAAPDPDSTEPVAVFKAAGWRGSQVVALWLDTQEAPWLLVTSLPGTAARLQDYARRWAIERLFVSWKSHGWDVEAGGVAQPARLGRLLSALSLATYWQLAMGLPVAHAQLDDLAARAAQRPLPTGQLPLPFPPAPSRPWAAKFSLYRWGAKVAQTTNLRQHTPTCWWAFPDWTAPPWSAQCQQTYHAAT